MKDHRVRFTASWQKVGKARFGEVLCLTALHDHSLERGSELNALVWRRSQAGE